MGKHLTNFEQSIKEGFDSFEAPYDSSSWDSLEQRLDIISGASSGSLGSFSAFMAAALVILLGGSIFYFTLISPQEFPTAKTAIQGDFIGSHMLDRDLDAADLISNDIIEDSLIADSNTSNTARNDSDSSKPNQNQIENIETTENVYDDVNTSNSSVSETDSDDLTSNLAQAESSSEELVFIPSIAEACAGVDVSFELTSNEIDGSYLWNFGDGNFSNQRNPVHAYSKPGVYDVTLSVTSKESGVINTQTIDNLVVINPKPEARFKWDFVNKEAFPPSVRFINESERAEQATWFFNDADSNSEINPEIEFTKAGEVIVKLQVSNEYGCEDEMYQYLNIENAYNLLAPDAFSPNSDGLNDSFMPEALKLRDVDFKLTIYKGSTPVFESNDKFDEWNGVLPNGTLALPGETFPWTVSMVDEEGIDQFYSGTITITP